MSALVALHAAPVQAEPPRDPWRWPFAPDAVWNQSIGSGAVYVPAGLTAPDSLDPDPEFFAQVNPGDAVRPILQPATFGAPYGATGPYRSDGTSPAWTTVYQVPIQVPDGFLVPDVDYSLNHYQTPNDCATLLQPDGSSLVQFEPTTRLRADGPLWGIPQLWDAAGTNLFADGRRGTHYGSGLSAIGGSIRRGELSGQGPLRHALKVELSFAQLCKGGGDGNNVHATYRWPATNSDGGGDGAPYRGSNPALKMGSLLAIPPDVTEAGVGGLTTVAGRKIFHALQDYGAYVVDTSSTDGNPVNLCLEDGAQAEVPEGWAKDGAFAADLAKIFPRLAVVDNNAPGSVGGGGAPRQPPAPPFRYGGQSVGALAAVPGRIEAEDYDVGGEGVGYHDGEATQWGNVFDGNSYRNDGVDVRRCQEDGGYQVGWTSDGEWMNYGVQVPAAGGTFGANFRVSTGFSSCALHLEDEQGNNVSGPVSFGSTGDWDTFVTVTAPHQVTLGPGAHTLRVVVDAGGFDLNWFELR